jgi:hypothetical protein
MEKQGTRKQRKLRIRTSLKRLAVFCYGLFAMVSLARGETGGRDTSKSRLQWIRTISDIEKDIILEAKTDKPSVSKIKRGLEKLREIVSTGIHSYEIRLRGAVAASVACRWEKVRSMCWEAFGTLVQDLRQDTQTIALANYFSAYKIGTLPVIQQADYPNFASNSSAGRTGLAPASLLTE